MPPICIDAALTHAGRPAADSARDALDHPAEMLRLAGIKPGMKVADVLAGDGYYSELRATSSDRPARCS